VERLKIAIDVEELERLFEIKALLKVAAQSRGNIRRRLIERAIALAEE